MRSENYIIQLELEIQRLREENEMLRIELFNKQNDKNNNQSKEPTND